MPGGVQEGKTGFYFLPIRHICHSCGNIDKFKEWFHPLYWKFSHVTCYGNLKTNDHGYDLLAQSVQWITSHFVCGGKFLRHCPFHSLDLFFHRFCFSQRREVLLTNVCRKIFWFCSHHLSAWKLNKYSMFCFHRLSWGKIYVAFCYQ